MPPRRGVGSAASSHLPPSAPDHPEVRRLEQEAAARARAAGKVPFFDMVARTGAQELMLGQAREFVARHARDPVSP